MTFVWRFHIMSEDRDYIVLNVPRGTEQSDRILTALRAEGFTVRMEETDECRE